MCPFCVPTAVIALAGITSSTGAVAVVARRFGGRGRCTKAPVENLRELQDPFEPNSGRPQQHPVAGDVDPDRYTSPCFQHMSDRRIAQPNKGEKR